MDIPHQVDIQSENSGDKNKKYIRINLSLSHTDGHSLVHLSDMGDKRHSPSPSYCYAKKHQVQGWLSMHKLFGPWQQKNTLMHARPQ
jgi:hypothetical protein